MAGIDHQNELLFFGFAIYRVPSLLLLDVTLLYFISSDKRAKQLIDREEQGRIIAKMTGSVKRVSDVSYVVRSQSGNGGYNVNSTEIGWNCSCLGDYRMDQNIY